MKKSFIKKNLVLNDDEMKKIAGRYEEFTSSGVMCIGEPTSEGGCSGGCLDQSKDHFGGPCQLVSTGDGSSIVHVINL
ncbi:MAG: hypothetical protein LBL90_06510 [Prevotellaceae bacterium]|jgi:hypothetical protein|nr:hypothetical protein [Prevotellaceae bacterium]